MKHRGYIAEAIVFAAIMGAAAYFMLAGIPLIDVAKAAGQAVVIAVAFLLFVMVVAFLSVLGAMIEARKG